MKQEIHNIWCSALNYHDTAKEINTSAPLKEPIFFLKSGSTISHEDQLVILPSFSHEVLYEVEIALQFNKNLEAEWIGLALDLTARDLQKKLKTQAFPWTLAKSFKGSCPIGSFIPIKKLDRLDNLDFSLEVNNSLRQKGNTRDMVFSCRALIIYLLAHFPVCPYDLLLTGTPAGASQIKKGDRLIGKIADHYMAHWTVHE
jgi:acylpyruvate hydrolase